MESEIKIENLPDHILEEIFSYSSDKENLREVSKRFCDIVNFSPKLMSKFTLYVHRIKREDINNIRGRYQNIKFNNFDSKDVEFVKQYNWKQSVKNIHFTIHHDSHSIQKFEMFKSILSEFDHLLDIHVDCQPSFPYLKYSSEEFRNIRSLKINNLHVLSFFLNAPNLKKLDIFKVSDEYFTQPINWKLKELYIDYLEDSNMDTFAKFLETQRSTLTILKINNCSNILNVIIHKLPNLEVLHLKLSRDDYINEWLLPNDKLKELAIINSYLFNGRLLEQVLKHYRYIEKLYMDVNINLDHELKMKNIKHLTVTEESFDIFKYLRSDNLTSLTLIGEKIGKFKDIPKDIFSKVETLKVEYMKNPAFLNNFSALSHLYIMSMDYISQREFEILVSSVLESTNLKSLSLFDCLCEISVPPQEYSFQKDYPDNIIKMYDSHHDMLDETDREILWAQEFERHGCWYDSD